MHGQIRISEGTEVVSPMGAGVVVGFQTIKNTDSEGNALRGRPTTLALVAGLKTNRGQVRKNPVAFSLKELDF